MIGARLNLLECFSDITRPTRTVRLVVRETWRILKLPPKREAAGPRKLRNTEFHTIKLINKYKINNDSIDFLPTVIFT